VLTHGLFSFRSEGPAHARLPGQRPAAAGTRHAAAQAQQRRMGGEDHQLVYGAPRHAARRRHDGVPEDRAGPRDVRRQLLRHQEQEGHRALARRRRTGIEHLREGRQADAENWFPLVPMFIKLFYRRH